MKARLRTVVLRSIILIVVTVVLTAIAIWFDLGLAVHSVAAAG